MTLPSSYQHTPLDEIMPPWSFGVIYAFPCDENHRERCLQVLQRGYTELLRLWPYLGGDVVHDGCPGRRPGHLSLVLPEHVPDIELAVLDLSDPSSGWDHNYAEVVGAGLPPRWLDAKLFAPYAAGLAVTTKPFLVQVNWIPGGCLLTTSILHAVMDGSGMDMVMQTWARLCREMQLSETHGNGVTAQEMPTNLATTPIASQIPVSGNSFDDLKTRPELWKLLGLHQEATLALTPPPHPKPAMMPAAKGGHPDMRTAIFSISQDASARLKTDATLSDGGQWISTSDVVTALLWRSVMRARFPDAEEPPEEHINTGRERPKSVMVVPLNGRSLFKPELPQSHINNVIYCCINELPLHDVVGPEPLATLARTIRRGIETIKSDATLAQDAYTLASLLPDVRKLIPSFADISGRNFVTSSWVDFPLYDVDFGPALGKPELIRLPRYQWFGFHVIGPRKRNGDVELFICLNGEEMDRLRKDVEFQEYATFVAE